VLKMQRCPGYSTFTKENGSAFLASAAVFG
jgi:hypothetical protein